MIQNLRVIFVITILFISVALSGQVTLIIDIKGDDSSATVGELCLIDSVGITFIEDVSMGRKELPLLRRGNYDISLLSNRFEDWKTIYRLIY